MAIGRLELVVADDTEMATLISYYEAQFVVVTRDAEGVLLHRRKRRWFSLATLQLVTAALLQIPPDTPSLGERAAADQLRRVSADIQEIRIRISSGTRR